MQNKKYSDDQRGTIKKNPTKYTYRRQKCVKRQHIEKWCRRTQIFATHIYHNIMRGENSIATYISSALMTIHLSGTLQSQSLYMCIEDLLSLSEHQKWFFFNEKKDALEILPG